MKRIVAVNASPRIGWNTATLVREAAEGARAAGADVQLFDLYRLEKFTGCVSCFGCKLPPNEGKCVCRDGLAPVLDAIRAADGLILGSPNYLSDISAGLRALYERLVFQSLTYRTEKRSCSERRIPVLFIMTSNAPEEAYGPMGYAEMLDSYRKTLDTFVGGTRIMLAGNTLQVKNYDRFNWTMFDPDAKRERHEKVFPEKKREARLLGSEMVQNAW